MNFLITGGSGFIGRSLCRFLIDAGHEVTVFSRNVKKSTKILPNSAKVVDTLDYEQNYNVIVNLAGEPLVNKRWTQTQKQCIYTSRLETTEKIIDLIEKSEHKPALLLSSSAVGFYGYSDSEEFTEGSAPANYGFTHDLCDEWEQKAYLAREYDVRVCVLRTGLVLESFGGVLAKMLPIFKFGLGGKMGTGAQWVSWVHMDDLLGIMMHIVDDYDVDGAVNVTAPEPVSNDGFIKALGNVLKRPTFLTIPAVVLNLLYGEMANLLLLKGQKVLPKKILETGYKFKYENIDEALKGIMRK